VNRRIALGDVIADRFRLVADIGRGGMGHVFEAVDLKHDRQAAIKVIYRQLAEDPEFRARFQREAQAAERANHPHVLPVWDYGSAAGHLYLATPLCDTDLAGMLGDSGRVEPETAIAIMSQIAWALDWAHGRDVVHRDVKPENILIVAGPTQAHAYLADFGMAKVTSSATLTQAGAPAGLSPAYAAPEQWSGDRVVPATDQYAVAGTLYCCLAGHPPFWPLRSTDRLRDAHLHLPPPPIRIATDPRVEHASRPLLRGLQKDPADRYETCGELVAAVQAALHGLPAAGDDRTVIGPFDPRAETAPEHPSAAGEWSPLDEETEPETGNWPMRGVFPGPAAPPASDPVADVAPPPAPEHEPEPEFEAEPEPGFEPAPEPEPERAVGEAPAAAPPAERPPVVAGAPDAPAGAEPAPAAAGEERRWRRPGLIAALVGLPIAVVAAALIALGVSGGQDTAGETLPGVPVGTRPADAFAAAGSVWVANQGDGTVTRLDERSAKPVGAPVEVFDDPYRLAGAEGRVWAISGSASEAAQIDVAGPRPTVETVSLPSDPYDIAGGEGSVWIAANASGPREAGRLIALDPASRERRASLPVTASLLGVATGHGSVWALEDRGVLVRVGPDGSAGVATVAVGPGGSAVTADSEAVWVANAAAGRLLRVDPDANRVAARIAVRPTGEVALAAGGGSVWWIDKDRGTVTRIDPESGEPVGSPVRVGSDAGGATVAGGSLWVTVPSAGSVVRIRM
jgi:serine/threonine protein kinase/streptogramin lyase